MSIGAPPPAQPPQLSPDHKWVWDGTQWRPLAVHEAVFPNWGSVGAGVPADVSTPAQTVPQPLPIPAPAPVYRAPAREPGPAVPLWVDQSRSGGFNGVLFLVAGVIALVVVAVVLSNFLPTSLPWQQTSAGQPAVSPTPPITDYSQFGRADRLVNKLIAPPMADLTQSLGVVGETCTGQMTLSCEDALSNTDIQAHRVLAVIDAEYIPTCIEPNVGALRSDLVNLDSAALLALKGAKEGQASDISSGLRQVVASTGRLQTDNAALRDAVKSAGCSSI